MIKHFIILEWKQFFRSAYWQKNLALNLLLVFLALYFIIIFLALGFLLLPLLNKIFPEQDAFIIVNSFLFYWFLGDLLFRFFMQKLPVMSVKPLLTLPVKRTTVVHYVLGKSALSFFNFLPLFAIIPFTVMLIVDGYDATTIIVWAITVFIIVLISNFLNFIIESFSSETAYSFLPVIALVGGCYALDFFELVSFKSFVSNAVLGVANNPLFMVIPLAILGVCYWFNFKLLKNKLFLDAGLQSKVKAVKTANLTWTNRFGDIAPFLQLDLKLIWRNKRTKSMLPLTVIFLFYGLIFYPNPVYQDKSWFFAFIGIFVTGIFLINFGQFIPAWDSGYYKLLMSQNLKYKQYLKSKFILMVLSVTLLFVLSIPYVYFGWKILLAHFAAAIYNIGINSHVMLFGGSFNRKKIDLNKKAVFNYQGTGAVQWLIGLPLMAVPMLIFATVNWLVNFEAASLTLIVLGVIGVMFHQKLMVFISNKYQKSKYKMINAFSQDN